ncbi:hypothetical protein GGH95_004247, partial [Coemansia sp. RSA 1836]
MLEDEVGRRAMRRRNNGRESETDGLRSQDAKTSSSTRSSRSRSRARRQVTTSDAVAGGTVVVRPKDGGETRRVSRSVGPRIQPTGTVKEARTQRMTRSQAATICAMAEAQEMPLPKRSQVAEVVDSGNSSSASSTSTRGSHSSRTKQPLVAGGDSSRSESPTLLHTLEKIPQQPAMQSRDAAGGVVTRSMARRLETHGGASIPLPTRIPLPPTSVPSPPARVSPAPARVSLPPESTPPTQSALPVQSASPVQTAPPPANFSPHALSPRHVRRSPQYNYDRFIPARAATDLRMYSERAGSPTFSRRATHMEHRAQVDEANRTYDALLRAELLRDDLDGTRRMRASSPPPPARSAARRDAYRLPSSPNPLPSLVPWSSSSNGNSSRPTTPPPAPGAMHHPVFLYRSPRKATAALAA